MKAFQIVPPVVRDVGRGLEIDVDFLESLKVYLNYFEKFTVACPVRTGHILGSGLDTCAAISDLGWTKDQFEFIPLPLTYRLGEYLALMPGVRRKIISEIDKAQCLIFTPYSLIGDWPTVGIRGAIKKKRPYAIEADGVHDDINRKRFTSKVRWKRMIQENLLFPLAERSHRYCLEHSALGIFQGRDVYDAYAPYCSRPYSLNHHIPVYEGDHIKSAELQSKLSSVMGGDVLKICYAGRIIDMKGPLDWVDTLHHLMRRGVKFEATWLGDGPMIGEMRERIEQLGISGVHLAGFVADRNRMREEIRNSHIFMFCHNTLESARILGEALACGTPLVGFDSAYPAGLVAERGGGLFCKAHDVNALAQIVERLDRNRSELTQLILGAADTGSRFDRSAALTKRALLMQKYASLA